MCAGRGGGGVGGGGARGGDDGGEEEVESAWRAGRGGVWEEARGSKEDAARRPGDARAGGLLSWTPLDPPLHPFINLSPLFSPCSLCSLWSFPSPSLKHRQTLETTAANIARAAIPKLRNVYCKPLTARAACCIRAHAHQLQNGEIRDVGLASRTSHVVTGGSNAECRDVGGAWGAGAAGGVCREEAPQANLRRPDRPAQRPVFRFAARSPVLTQRWAAPQASRAATCSQVSHAVCARAPIPATHAAYLAAFRRYWCR